MDICKSKSRFATSQAPWEALVRATSCDFDQKPLSGAPTALGSAWEGQNRQVALFSRKLSARTAGPDPPPIQLTSKTFYLCISMDICKNKTHFAARQTLWEAMVRAPFLRFGQKITTRALPGFTRAAAVGSAR